MNVYVLETQDYLPLANRVSSTPFSSVKIMLGAWHGNQGCMKPSFLEKVFRFLGFLRF